MSGRQSNANRQQSQLPSVFDRLGGDKPRNIPRRGSTGRSGPPGRDGTSDRVITVVQPDNQPRRDRMVQQDKRQDTSSKESYHSRAPQDRPPPHSYRSANDIPVNPRPDRRFPRETEERTIQHTRRSPDRLPPQRERWSESNRTPVVEPTPPPPRRYEDRGPPRHNRSEPYDRRRNDRLGGNQDKRYGHDRPDRSYQRRDKRDNRPAAPPSHKTPPRAHRDENGDSNSRRVPSDDKESVKGNPREVSHENDENHRANRSETPPREPQRSPSEEAEPIEEEEELVKDYTEETHAAASAPLTSIVQKIFDRDEDEGIMQPDWGQDDDDLMDEDDFNVVVDAPEKSKQRESTPKTDSKAKDQPKTETNANKNRNEEKDAANDKTNDKRDSKKTGSEKSETRHKEAREDSSDPNIPSKDSPPSPWEKHKSRKGDYYYYNPETGQNTWKFPKAEEIEEASDRESNRNEPARKSSDQSAPVVPPRSVNDKSRPDVDISSERDAHRDTHRNTHRDTHRDMHRDTHRDTQRDTYRDTQRDVHAPHTSAPEEKSRPAAFDRQEHNRNGGKDQVREREHMVPPPAPKRMRRDMDEADQRRGESGHQDIRHQEVHPRQQDISSRASALPSQEDLFRRRDDFDRRSFRQPPPGRGPPPPRQAGPPHRRPLSPPPSRPMDVPPRRPRMSPPPPLAGDRRPGPPPPRRRSSPLPPRPRRLDEPSPADHPRRGREPYNVPPRDGPRPDRFHNRTSDNPNLVPLPVHHKDKAARSSPPPPLSGANEVVQEQRRPVRQDESKSVSRRQEVIMNSRIERNSRANGRNQDPPSYSTRR